MVHVGDENFPSGRADELSGCFDLRSHGAGGKLSVAEMLLRFDEREPIDRPLRRVNDSANRGTFVRLGLSPDRQKPFGLPTAERLGVRRRRIVRQIR